MTLPPEGELSTAHGIIAKRFGMSKEERRDGRRSVLRGDEPESNPGDKNVLRMRTAKIKGNADDYASKPPGHSISNPPETAD
jgi:hypothetical protein